MQLCSGSVNVHRRDDVCEDAETVQSMAVNPNGTILAVVTQMHLHFWSAGAKTVYLTSLLIPDTSLDDNPALFVLWRPRQGNHLAVVTARQVVFFEADINLRPGDFLQNAERQRNAVFIHHVDSASRVCYSSEIRIEAGLATAATAAGPYAFLVTTTAGVVYVVGWHQQDVLHQWTTVGLQDGSHSFTSAAAAAQEREAAAHPLASNAAATTSITGALNLASASVASSSLTSASALRPSTTSTPPVGVLRTDPLQRRYQQDPRPQAPPAAVEPTTPSTTATVSAAAPPFAAAVLGRDAVPMTSTSRYGFVPAAIRPPGAAIRSGEEDGSASPSPSASPTLLWSQDAGAASRQPTDNALQGGTAFDDAATTVTDAAETTAPFFNTKAGARSNSFLTSAMGATDSAARSGTEGSAGPSQRRANGADLLAGTILHASFVSRWKVLSFVFSSGNVLLCRPSCGTNFTHSKVQLQGCVTPIVSAFMVAVNMRHLLVAVCTQGGALSCRRVDGGTLAIGASPLWKGLRGIQERFTNVASAATSSPQSLGLIAAMEWCPSEELLCVAFYKHGVVLVHYGGGVVTHHLSSPACAMLLRSPGAAGLSTSSPNATTSARPGAAVGCSFVFWKPDGTRLWMAAPEQSCFFSTQLSRVLTCDTVGPGSGHHTPMTLLADNALYLVSVSETSARQGVRELVLLPEEYLRDQYPMQYGAVSSDGSWIACAGRRGMLIFNRDRFSWKLASKKEEEAAFSCVADPVWLRNIAVAVPALRTDRKTYELIVLSTASVSPSHALARVALEGKPAQLSCVHQDHRSEGYIVVVDLNQVVRVFRYDAFMDTAAATASATSAATAYNTTSTSTAPPRAYVALTPVQQLVLMGDLANPLQITPVCLRRAEDDRDNPQRTKDQTELRLLLHRRGDHALVWVRGSRQPALDGPDVAAALKASRAEGSLPLLTAVAEPFDSPLRPPSFVYRCWVDRTPPVRGAVVLTHEENKGLMLHQLQQRSDSSAGGGGASALEVHRVEVTPTRDTELLPVCVSPFDGYMLCIGTDTSVPRPPRRAALADSVNTLPHPQLVLRPVLYAHRVLSLLLHTAVPRGASAAPTRSSSSLITTPRPTAAGGSAAAKALSRTTSEYAAATSAALDLSGSPPSTAEIDGRVAAFLWDRSLFQWLECMRLNNTFVPVMDFFLHTALNESPPAAVPGLGRRSAVRAVIALLRNYPEFYSIVVGCVRKIDFTRWHLVLDFLGTPTALFHECVAHHCYAEAVHLVRVIMMGSYKPAATLSVERVAELSAASVSGGDALASRTHSSNSGGGVGSLEQATQCAIELFGLAIENGDYAAAYDLLRFMALLEEEIGMPAAGGVDYGNAADGATDRGGTSAASSEGFLTRWLRQLTFSGAAYDDPEAAMEEPADDQSGRQSSTREKGGDDKTEHQVGSYPTLVLDVARCEVGHGGQGAEDAAEEGQRQSAVRHMFNRHKALPAVVHQEALRLLLTGYVTQLAKLMETFSFSVMHFLRAAGKVVNLTRAAEVDGCGSSGGAADRTGDVYTLHLHEVFDGLHKELGLPRSFHVPSTATATTAWNLWIIDQQKARAASLPGVLSATNPRVWTVAQSVLYAIPQLRTSVESLHHIFSGVFVYNLAFCVLLMRKSDLISLLLSADGGAAAPPVSGSDDVASAAEMRVGVTAENLITVLDHLEALLAVPENAGYKPFLQDVFQSLPPSALRARGPTPSPAAAAVSAQSGVTPSAEAS